MNTVVDAGPMREVERILHIVDRIYAAACGEATWVQAVARMCQFGRLDGGALSMIDARERRRVVLASCGLGSRTKPDATDSPITGDALLLDSVLRSAPGAVWHHRQVASEELAPTISSWMQGHGLVSWACVIIGREQRQVACLEVYAEAGCASSYPDLDQFLRQLAPHLTRAWGLGGTRESTLATPAGDPSPARSRVDAAPAADLAGLPEAARLRAEFGLTKAEARLALRLAEGSSLASAAQAFNVKLTTIRSQLQQVFAKTGTCRQTELVAMLLSRGYGSRPLPWMPQRSLQAEAALAAW